MKYVDLHTHSTASDGTDSPARVARRAREAGLAAFALTDHDTTAGLEEAAAEARAIGIDFVPGCEISTRTDRGSMHILGLWIPKNNSDLENFLHNARSVRDSRNVKMLARLQELGINLTAEELAEMAGGESVGRPHMANALVKKGVARDAGEAFSKYLGKGGKAYVPKEAVNPAAACRALAKAGATVILAHPLLEKPDPAWLESQVGELVKHGLAGLEVWHTVKNEANEALLLDMARRHGLLVSGGTDYHGANKPDIAVGSGMGNLAVPYSVYENLRAARKSRGLPC